MYNMSHNDEIKPEYKTIRLDATSYYKLVELGGLLSVVTGTNQSISSLASMIVTLFHSALYSELVRTIGNPKLLEERKALLSQNLNYLMELTKNVRVTK